MTLLACTALATAGYMLRTHGLVADRTPGPIETAIARRLVVLSVPSRLRALTNPRALDANAWRAGADHFAEHCAVCHGRDGRGASEIGQKMYPPVPDLAAPAIQNMADGTLFAIIQNGVSWTGMPAFRSEHTADETWQLVSFIRRVPTLTPEDLHSTAQNHDDVAAPDTVAIDGTSFAPAALTVHLGETVTWINKDPFPHNVTSSSGSFRSGDLAPDAQWRFQATKPGTFAYVCTLHPGMKGTLVVKD
jgi:plastocyanin/cytochrome c553